MITKSFELKFKCGDLVRTTENYKYNYCKSDMSEFGFYWDIGEVIKQETKFNVKVLWFGLKPVEGFIGPIFIEKINKV